MYATKRLSEFKVTPEAALQPPPEGPSSGYLVVKEEDPDEETNTCCWGFCCGPRIRELPFPQNKFLTLKYSRQEGENRRTYTETVLFVPVLNLPLSANRYYVVVAKGKRQGQVYTCSKEEDMTTCCFCQCTQDVKPKPFDHRDIYHQIEIIPHKGRFTAKSVAADGFPPWIFRQKYWTLHENKPMNEQLGEAFGINKNTRLNYLELNTSTNVIAGKWYCPFIFLKEGSALKDQMKRSIFYEVTLEQFWEEVYSGTAKKRILFQGKDIMQEERESTEGFVWFRKTGDVTRERIGLSLALWERVKWEENREGWDEGASTMSEVKFGGFVLVERFSFKRLDGSVVLALDFIHSNKVRSQ
ncbi:hypothetical protein LUZ63_002169 [Rhynchospora breviuscula]|uniref:Uncharacterized protein n=1 Tax=Rhynchospora breviuscula TaxID=2022672 RepID=A0A9Q0HY86_9POAL|nr:hypothetical protein LUZ63_002169 [Rhynchospora breviuscula]